MIEGASRACLIDTGASASFVRAGVCSAPVIPGNEHRTIQLAARDREMTVLGTQTINFSVNNVNFKWTFFVATELREDVVLGYDWCVAEDLVFDTRRRCVHFGRGSRVTAYTCPPVAGDARHAVEFEVSHGFPATHEQEFVSLLREFADVFSDAVTPAATPSVRHTIRLKRDAPFRVRSYHYSDEKKRIIYQQVEEMLAAGVIEPSISGYCSPIVIVTKKSGKPRFCVDYRRLNDISEDEATPLPLIHETLRDLGPAQVFSSLDLKSGYWQIPMDDASKHLTAFATPDGALYQFRVMPFGLKNAPSTFQRFMTQQVLVGQLQTFSLVYLDDIIVYSPTYDLHMRHLRVVLERLATSGLRCAPEKCQFARREIEYLGHRVGADGNTPQVCHVRQISGAATPTSRKQLRSFLGTCNWLRDYVPRFAEIVAPLTDLLCEKRKWRWTSVEDAAFHAAKDALSGPLRLSRPDSQRPFVLQTDASGIGMAAVLYQEREDGGRNVIAYASARFSGPERRYHINEQECLAIVWGIRRFRGYLEDRPFVLRTDNRALLWLNRSKDAKAKLTRWSLLLQEFNFRIEHCPGRCNELPDTLSRDPDDVPVPPEVTDEERLLPPQASVATPDAGQPNVLCAGEVRTLTDEIKAGQLQDRSAQRLIRRWIHFGRRPAAIREAWERRFVRFYTVHDGYLYRLEQSGRKLVVPLHLTERVMYCHHDIPTAGHPGAEETLRAIQEAYYWPAVGQDVRRYVRECLLCAQFKRRPRHATAGQRPRAPTRPGETVAIDVMGPYPETPSGNRFIVGVTDLFTRWVEAFPVQEATTDVIVTLLEREVFSRFGYPREIISDNGPQFLSYRFQRACETWQAQSWLTAVFHPRANPQERRNQELKKGLRIRLHGRRPELWDRVLSQTLFSIRRNANAATGMSPSQLMLGYNLPHPGDWAADPPPQREAPEDRQRRARDAQARYIAARAPRQPRPEPPEFQPGDQVLTRVFDRRFPFGPRWAGPYTVQEATGDTTYRLQVGRRRPVYHVDDLRPAPPRGP